MLDVPVDMVCYYKCAEFDAAYVHIGPLCKGDISTFRCEDYIPGDVPIGVTKVILEYFTNDQFINNSTFSTSGWRNNNHACVI